MPTPTEDLRERFREEVSVVQGMANRAHSAAHDHDSTDSDQAAMELIGNRAIDLVIAIGRLR